jgi:2-amino-4-hydroxy-6-hydroxymethyldihydropteridine diphosphokinase
MNQVYFLIGGNIGNRVANLEMALKLIEQECGAISHTSAIYETAPWGKKDQPYFLNQALIAFTILSPPKLLENVLAIEKQMGRYRVEKFGSRIIDMDILFYNDEVINTGQLTVPHPEMQNRRFVLEPLAEIAPQKIHPILKKSVKKLLDECPDTLSVKKYRW